MRRLTMGPAASAAAALLALNALPTRAQDEPAGLTPHVAAACEVTLRDADFVAASADIARALDLLGPESRRSFMIRRSSNRMHADACVAVRSLESLSRSLSLPALPAYGAALLPVDTRVAINTGYPRDWNDGAQWSGAGLSTSITAGAAFRWGVLEAAITPVFGFQQNQRFDTHKYPDTVTYSR